MGATRLLYGVLQCGEATNIFTSGTPSITSCKEEYDTGLSQKQKLGLGLGLGIPFFMLFALIMVCCIQEKCTRKGVIPEGSRALAANAAITAVP